MDDIDKLLAQQMTGPGFRQAWEATEIEDQIRRMLIEARAEHNLSQSQFAKICGIRQSNLSRIETGAESPRIATLAKIASRLGKKLQIQLV